MCSYVFLCFPLQDLHFIQDFSGMMHQLNRPSGTHFTDYVELRHQDMTARMWFAASMSGKLVQGTFPELLYKKYWRVPSQVASNCSHGRNEKKLMRWKYNLPDKFKYSGQGFWHGAVFGNTRLVAFPPPLVFSENSWQNICTFQILKIWSHSKYLHRFQDVSKRRKIWEALKSSKFPPANTGAQLIWFKGQDPARPKESKGVSKKRGTWYL